MSIADTFHLINDTTVYIGRIVLAVYFLAPLSQGDWTTVKRRFMTYGPPCVGALVYGWGYRFADWSVMATIKWACRQYAACTFGSGELGDEMKEEKVWLEESLPAFIILGVNVCLLCLLAWWGWKQWRIARR